MDACVDVVAETLPSPRMKHQKTAASTRRDRSNSADIEEESSVQREQNWIATPTDAKTRNKPRQSDNVWVPGVDEYDEDVGRTESQYVTNVRFIASHCL